MAFSDKLQSFITSNASTFTDAIEGQSTDSSDTTDASTQSDPYANLSSKDVMQEYYKIAGQQQQPTALPNPMDKLKSADYYPTENNNPEKTVITPGGGSLPFTSITTGGAPLYPFAVRQARRDAINNAAYQQALANQNKINLANRKYSGITTYAPYQTEFNDKVNALKDKYRDYVATHGMQGINDILNEDSDISRELDGEYRVIDSEARSIKDAQAYSAELGKQQAEGKYLSPATQQKRQELAAGQWSPADAPKIMATMSAYSSLDETWGKRPLIEPDTIQTYATTLKDANGNPIAATDKERAVDVISKKVVSDALIQQRMDAMRADPYPGTQEQIKNMTDAALRTYVKAQAESEVASTVEKMENFENVSQKEKDQNLNDRYEFLKKIATTNPEDAQALVGTKYQDGIITNAQVVNYNPVTTVNKTGGNTTTSKKDAVESLTTYTPERTMLLTIGVPSSTTTKNTDGTTTTTTDDKNLVYHTYAIPMGADKKHGLLQLNNAINENVKGTTNFVPNEDIDKKYSGDDSWKNQTTQTKPTGTGINQAAPLPIGAGGVIDKTKLQSGQTYQTTGGAVVWDGTKFINQ